MKIINDIIKEIIAWKRTNPDHFFYAVETDNKKLRYVIKVVTNNGEKEFYLHMGATSRDRASETQHKIIGRYLDAIIELREAEQLFIKLFTAEIN